jgi:hypothetical protein
MRDAGVIPAHSSTGGANMIARICATLALGLLLGEASAESLPAKKYATAEGRRISCTHLSVRRTRDAFILLYRKKYYVQARSKLEPVLGTCGTLLTYAEAADVRNDLSVTLYHLGEHAHCLKMLEPLRELAQTDDEALRAIYAPVDAEKYIEIAAKSRNNLSLCRAAVQGVRPIK